MMTMIQILLLPALPGMRPWRPSLFPLVITVGSKFTLYLLPFIVNCHRHIIIIIISSYSWLHFVLTNILHIISNNRDIHYYVSVMLQSQSFREKKFFHLASYSYVTTASSEPKGRAMMNLLYMTMIRRKMMVMTMTMMMRRSCVL